MTVEFTSTRRAGIGKFTFHGNPSKASAVFTAYTSSNRHDASSSVSYDSSTGEITGVVRGGEFCNPNANSYKIYMVARLDQSITGNASLNNGAERVVIVDVPSATKVVYIKFALSYTSLAKAKLNLGELGSVSEFPFKSTLDNAKAEWASLLSTIAIEDTNRDSDKKIFYTALWRVLQHPTIYQDKDGSYRGFDDQVHNISEHTIPRPLENMYTDFSGWDVYRFHTPLIAFLLPEVASDMAQSLTIQAHQSKRKETADEIFPRWTVGNDDANMMNGNPGQIIVANMYAFGGRNFDIDTAWSYSKKDSSNGCSSNVNAVNCQNPVYSYQFFLQNAKPTSPFHRQGAFRGAATWWQAASEVIEYTAADFAKAQIAKAIYEKTPQSNTAKRRELSSEYDRYVQSAGRWRELIRKTVTGNVSAAKTDIGSYFEGTASQFRWIVPFDGKALFSRGLGRTNSAGRTQTPLQVLESHASGFKQATDSTVFMYMGNQVCLSAPWLFNYVKKPTRTQYYVREVMEKLYKNSIDGGLPGNDDLGTLSAWYVAAALGLAPTVPAVPVFLFNTPYFSDVTINRMKVNINALGTAKKVSSINALNMLLGDSIKIKYKKKRYK